MYMAIKAAIYEKSMPLKQQARFHNTLPVFQLKLGNNMSTMGRIQLHGTGADPGINYEGLVGVHKSMDIIMKGKGGCTTV